MRVYFDHQITSLQDSGGISRYHYQLAHYCSLQPGLDVEFGMGINNSMLSFTDISSERAKVWGWRVDVGSRRLRYALNEVICNFAAVGLRTVDIYHPTLYRCMPLLKARRIVATHHDCIYERFPEISKQTFKVIRAKQKQFARADAIISVSESSKVDLLQFYSIEPSKVHVIHHGVSSLPRTSESRAYLHQLVPEPFLLFVGSRASYKNFPAFLHAYAEGRLQNDYRLLVLGGGSLNPSESALCAQLGLSDRITVIGRAADSLLAEAYARAHLLIYPSVYEGFGFPPLEAMLAGCPVLVARSSSLPEVCGNAAFYFDPSDEDSLSINLVRAVANEPERRAAVKEGLRASALFTWDKCAAKTLALYRSLL